MINLVGQQFGNYRLVRLLGQGGFAEVYLGEHIYFGSYAALKVLSEHLKIDEQQTLLHEARIIAHLKHPNIVKGLEFGMEGVTSFLVLNYAPNGNLRQLHPEGTILPIADILPYVKQIASALQYLHNEKLIYLAVKPENILLGDNREVQLCDFGETIVAQTSPDEKTPLIGTIQYMAPEQFTGHASPASDQYALGVVIYEWLCGVAPFNGSTIDVIWQHIYSAPPLLRKKVPTISSNVEQVVLRALFKNPQMRFPTIQDFVNALEQAWQQEQSTSHYLYDVALSFAGEDRKHADALAEALRHRRLNIFYDKYEKSTLWGKNLYTYLSDIYQEKARYCVMFLSQHYADKLWTNHEREAAQARAFSENEEYILPVRLDNTKIPGIPTTVAYLSWPPETAETIVDAIMVKLNKMPPTTEEILYTIDTIASNAVLILGRFTSERKKVLDVIRDELVANKYLPLSFDDEKPSHRNFTETTRILAHLSRFIIADLTDSSSILQNLYAIVPTLAVPVQPLLQASHQEFSIFDDFKRYHWVLPIHRYEDIDDLLKSLKEYVIEPAEQKAKELEKD